MAQTIVALVLTAVGISAASSSPPAGLTFDPYVPHVRDLVLRAAGSQEIEPGMTRVPILADGAVYEVIVVAPGLARLIPATAGQPAPKR